MLARIIQNVQLSLTKCTISFILVSDHKIAKKMQTINVTDTRKNLAEILNKVAYQEQGFVIERRGKPMALILPPQTASFYKKKLNKGVNPSSTAGTIDLAETSLKIEQVFEKITKPYEKKSLF